MDAEFNIVVLSFLLQHLRVELDNHPTCQFPATIDPQQ